MSDIPVSTVVRVTISTAPTFPSRRGFGTLLIIGSSDVISVAERYRPFATMDEVEAVFSPDTQEWRAAATAFQQNPAPARIFIGRRAAEDLPAVLRGGGNPATLAAFKAVADATLNIQINGEIAETAPFSLAAALDLPGVAALTQTALRAADASAGFATARVIYREGRFLVESGTVGAEATISFGIPAENGTDLSTLMQLSSTEATKADGVNTETAVEAAMAANDASSDWYGLAFTNELRDNVAQLTAVAEWVEARVKVFGNDSDDRDILDMVNPNDIATVFKARNFRRTMTCLNYRPDEYLAVSALTRAFIVNFNAANSTITLKFKQMPGITAYPLRTSQKTALDFKRANAFYTVGGNPMFGEGYMANGIFFDEVHGLDWLQNAIETNVFGKLYTDTTKTPMTDPGVASLQQKVEEGLAEGERNGLLAPGFDRDNNFLQKGYVTATIPMKDWNQSDKERRQAPPITFVALGAGAIHGIEINGTFQR